MNCISYVESFVTSELPVVKMCLYTAVADFDTCLKELRRARHSEVLACHSFRSGCPDHGNTGGADKSLAL
jgi:hypothetical protein